MNRGKTIYLDHAATTPVDPLVVETMMPYYVDQYGNASSLHRLGRAAHEALEKSRETVARVINARSEEIVFTGSGTEADNLAVKGVARRYRGRRNRVITSSIEHHAVLETCEHLKGEGFKATLLPVSKDGIVDPAQLEKSIDEDTVLVSIMHSNNEIGTLQPIEEIAEIAHAHGAFLHTDAIQSIGKVEVDVGKEGIDLLSMSAHKIYGPKGVGALYIRKGVEIEPILHGGGHERGLRSSTENIPGIVGLATAMELAKERYSEDIPKVRDLRDLLMRGILEAVEDAHLAGHPTRRLPNVVSLYFPGIEGEALVLGLDEKGIAASSGSACSSLKSECSHVLLALGINEVDGRGSLRLSLGRDNTRQEVEYTVEAVRDTVSQMREISPLWGKTHIKERLGKEAGATAKI